MNEAISKLKELLTGNSEGELLINQLNDYISTEEAKKVSTIGEIKKLKEFKQEIQDTFQIGPETPLTDVLSNVKDSYMNTQTNLNKLKEQSSGKETEMDQLKRLMAETQKQMADLTNDYNSERRTNKLNDIKSNFRKELASQGIKDVNAQDLVINANLTAIENTDNLSTFAQSIAKEHSYLTQSNHKQGVDSIVKDKINTKTSLADCKTDEDRKAYYQSILDENKE